MTATLPYPTLAADSDFAPLSRVWMYLADRNLSDAEVAAVNAHLTHFCRQWTAHNMALKARGEVFAHRLLLLMVDETLAGASGCSIDKSVHFLEAIGHELRVDWFDRMQFAWLDKNGDIAFGTKSVFEDKVHTGHITPETPMMNTLANTREALQTQFWVAFQGSWQKKLV
ncbi:MAG: hypothetical protein SFV52_08665 [Saprospiraceae bacterium]|nr:hypothetical protein [Saprospiraceae bacterium]